MATPILMKRSAVAAKAPATTDLQLGELAINTTDGKLFFKKSVSGTETIVEVGAGINAVTQAALDAKANLATTYTKTETDTRIQLIVGSAPAALDTLAEIAAQLQADESAAATLVNTVALKAPIASPTFTGTVSGITATMVGAYTTAQVDTALGLKAATTYVDSGLALKAPLASPTFTGTPAAPTALAGTNTTQVATTAFVTTGLVLKSDIASPTFTGVPAAPTATLGTNTTQIATTAFVTAAIAAAVTTLDGGTF
jgi:hypothetical protein